MMRDPANFLWPDSLRAPAAARAAARLAGQLPVTRWRAAPRPPAAAATDYVSLVRAAAQWTCTSYTTTCLQHRAPWWTTWGIQQMQWLQHQWVLAALPCSEPAASSCPIPRVIAHSTVTGAALAQEIPRWNRLPVRVSSPVAGRQSTHRDNQTGE